MTKLLLSTALVLTLSTQVALAGPGMDKIQNIISESELPVELTWQSEEVISGAEVYNDIVFNYDGDEVTAERFFIQDNDDGTTTYKLEKMEAVSPYNGEKLYAQDFFISTHPEELMQLFHGPVDLEETSYCDSNTKPTSIQLFNFGFSSVDVNVEVQNLDISMAPVWDNEQCMVTSDYTLNGMSLNLEGLLVELGSMSGDMYNSSNGYLPSKSPSRDLTHNSEMKNLKVTSDSGDHYGGFKSITLNGYTNSESMSRLIGSKFNDLIAFAENPENFESSDVSSGDFDSMIIMSLPNPEQDLAEIWNGLHEIIGEGNLTITEAYINKDLVDLIGLPVPQETKDQLAEFPSASVNMSFAKNIGDITYNLELASPDFADFKIGLGFGMEQTDLISTNLQMAALSLPIGLKSFSLSFKDNGLDSMVQGYTGQSLADYTNGAPSVNSTLASDWIRTGLNGATAFVTANSQNAIPALMLAPFVMGDWKNITSIFDVESSLK